MIIYYSHYPNILLFLEYRIFGVAVSKIMLVHIYSYLLQQFCFFTIYTVESFHEAALTCLVFHFSFTRLRCSHEIRSEEPRTQNGCFQDQANPPRWRIFWLKDQVKKVRLWNNRLNISFGVWSREVSVPAENVLDRTLEDGVTITCCMLTSIFCFFEDT